MSAALAHPDTLPHVHAADPAGFAVIVFWLAAGAIFFSVASRGLGRRAMLERAEPLASD